MNLKMYKSYIRGLLRIAVPIMVSNIISQVQMIIDRAFLGQKDPLFMSALGNVNSPMWTSMSFCFSIVTGTSILVSQAVGAGKKDDIEKYSAAMIKWNNVIPVLLFLFWTFFAKDVFALMGVSETLMPMCLAYTKYLAPVILIIGLEASTMVIMQTSNYTKPLVFFGIARSGLNVVLDWLLIFGNCGFPELGIEGAAIATTVSEYLGFIYALCIFVSSKKLDTRPSLKAAIKAPVLPFLNSMKLGINSALEEFAWNFGNLMLIRILNTIDEMAAGIYSMIFSIEILIVVVVGSIGNGTMTLCGEAKGRNDRKQFKSVCIAAYGMCIIVALLTLAISLVFPRQIIGLFTKDTGIISACTLYLVFMCLNLYGKSGNIIFGNGIRGSGDTRWMFIVQVFGTFFVIGCAALFVFVFKLGIVGVFLAVMADELVRAVINLLHLLRIIKKEFPRD